MVTRKYTLIYSLLFLCGSLLSFISSAAAQACTPVVYAFRHAEDLEAPGNGLTSAGQQHAFLYPAMVADFGVLTVIALWLLFIQPTRSIQIKVKAQAIHMRQPGL
jgi:hypothetical protein